MIVNPLTHIGGIYGCIAALAAGRKIALLEKFSVEAWVDAVKRNRPAVAPAVPSAVRMLLDADVDSADLSSLRALISGTAPLAPDLVDAFLEKYDIPICTNYGATEFRSEEHTSELQSLMRISYAVFCLKKKKKYT